MRRPRPCSSALKLLFFTAALGGITAACGRARAPDGAGSSGVPPNGGSKDAGAVDTASVEKPFAGSPSAATQLIGAAIDKQASEVNKCVTEYRARKKLPHERVEISVGIDQDGRLLGAALKGNKQDAPFSECVQRALGGAPFPRSHAGVIQVTKSYEEIAQ
jgi:hypothetical protein